MSFPRCCVYALMDPRDGAVRYIGITARGMKRIKSHGHSLAADRTHRALWLKQLRSAGLWCKVLVLEELPAEALPAAEMRWIAAARAEGWALTNLTDGGEGMNGFVATDEYRAKMSTALKGRKFTPEHRAKMSAWQVGRKLPETTRAKMRKPRSEETKAKMSATCRGRPPPPEALAATRRPVVDVLTGVRYASVSETARLLGTNRSAIQRHLRGTARSPRFQYEAVVLCT